MSMNTRSLSSESMHEPGHAGQTVFCNEVYLSCKRCCLQVLLMQNCCKRASLSVVVVACWTGRVDVSTYSSSRQLFETHTGHMCGCEVVSTVAYASSVLRTHCY